MDISEVAKIIGQIADGIEDACARCLDQNSGRVIVVIQEQLYCGVDGNNDFLSPTYDDDPFFEEEGPWYHRSKEYKAWKRDISPPVRGPILNLPARPVEVPNLFITGRFHEDINARREGDKLVINPGHNDGPAIVQKWGDQILTLADPAVQYFNEDYLLPYLDRFFKSCGYR